MLSLIYPVSTRRVLASLRCPNLNLKVPISVGPAVGLGPAALCKPESLAVSGAAPEKQRRPGCASASCSRCPLRILVLIRGCQR